jgi:hypothetical protein
MRYFAERLRTAQFVTPPADFSVVTFGHRVTFRRDDGRRQAFRIVGEDEADPRNGSISYVCPVARALTGKPVGEIVLAGDHEIEILSIDYGRIVGAPRCYRVELANSTTPCLSRGARRSKAIDTRLVGGSLLFGAGWGLAGLCLGPAILNQSRLSQSTRRALRPRHSGRHSPVCGDNTPCAVHGSRVRRSRARGRLIRRAVPQCGRTSDRCGWPKVKLFARPNSRSRRRRRSGSPIGGPAFL